MDLQSARIERGVQAGYNRELPHFDIDSVSEELHCLLYTEMGTQLRQQLSTRPMPQGALRAAVELLRLFRPQTGPDNLFPSLYLLADLRKQWWENLAPSIQMDVSPDLLADALRYSLLYLRMSQDVTTVMNLMEQAQIAYLQQSPFSGTTKTALIETGAQLALLRIKHGFSHHRMKQLLTQYRKQSAGFPDHTEEMMQGFSSFVESKLAPPTEPPSPLPLTSPQA